MIHGAGAVEKVSFRIIDLLPIGFGIAGCSFLPAAGPESIDIRSPTYRTLPYLLIKLSPAVVDVLKRTEPSHLAGSFNDLAASGFDRIRCR